MIGADYTYFLSLQYKFIENDKIEERTSLNETNDILDPILYPLGTCGVDSYKTIEHSQIHTFDPHKEDEEDEDDDLFVKDEDSIESNCCNGTIELVKFLSKSVFYVMKEIVFMHLGNVDINVVVSNVIKTKMI